MSTMFCIVSPKYGEVVWLDEICGVFPLWEHAYPLHVAYRVTDGDPAGLRMLDNHAWIRAVNGGPYSDGWNERHNLLAQWWDKVKDDPYMWIGCDAYDVPLPDKRTWCKAIQRRYREIDIFSQGPR